jgi:protein CWC15
VDAKRRRILEETRDIDADSENDEDDDSSDDDRWVVFYSGYCG